MAYHKWDAEYWEGQCTKLAKICRERSLLIVKLQGQLRAATERAGILDTFQRPILFIEDGAIESMPDFVPLAYTVIKYKKGYNEPRIHQVMQPYKISP